MAKKGSINQKQASKAGKKLTSDSSTKKQKTESAKKLNKHKDHHKHD